MPRPNQEDRRHRRPTSLNKVLEVKGRRGQIRTYSRVKPEQNRPQKADRKLGV